MNYLKESILIKLSSTQTRRTLVLKQYRNLLKCLQLKKTISSDIFLKTYLKIRITMNFQDSKYKYHISQIMESYWKGVDFLDILQNCEEEKNLQILIEKAYGPDRFIRALANFYSKRENIKLEKAERIMREKIQIHKLGYNYALPKEFLDYINSRPDAKKRYKKIYEPNFDKILK